MLMTGIFILLFLATWFAWYGKRQLAIIIFTASFIISIAVFIYHMTDAIGLSL